MTQIIAESEEFESQVKYYNEAINSTKPNKLQREEIGKLSTKLFGSSSRWQKLINSPLYRIPIGERLEPYNPKVTINKTVWSYEKALKLGLAKPIESIPKTQKRILYRNPTIDEMYYMLERHIDEKRLEKIIISTKLTYEEKKFTYVYNFVNYSMNYPWNYMSLKIKEGENIDTIVNSIPEDMAEDIRKYVSSYNDVEKENPEITVGVFDLNLFVEEIKNTLKNFGDATERYNELIEGIDEIAFKKENRK